MRHKYQSFYISLFEKDLNFIFFLTLEYFTLNVIKARIHQKEGSLMGFQVKMVQKKDKHISPSARAPKLQLAVKQQEDAGTYRKRCPKSKDKEEATARCRRGANTIKSKPIPAGWVTHRLENNKTKEVLTLL